MTRIFKDAKDYRTITKKISAEQRKTIEEKLGIELLPGQRETYQYYEMLASGSNVIGYIIAASQKGKYGAIEFIFGLNTRRKITGIYIQRARERDKEFKKSEFLNQFIGKGVEYIIHIEEQIKVRTVGITAILLGLKKELLTFDELAK